MGVVIERSAHSPLLVEGRDFSLSIYDRNGRLLEQTEYIPILGYATAPAVRCIAQVFEGKIRDGDVMLHNDPYSGGNQPSDWKVAKPVFFEGEHVAWVVVNAHQADVGGAVPGSYNPNATDIWQEALRIPPVKVYDAGELREDTWNLIMSNVRLPVVADDIHAMIGACNVGADELQALLELYGRDVWQSTMEEVLDATEALARSLITRIPDGVYAAEMDAFDDAFDEHARMPIRLRVTVHGDHMSFDFTGTHPQTPGYVNAPLPVTVSAVLIAFFMLVEGDIPHNDAIMRCIDVTVPEGTMLNPVFPAATGFGNHLSDQTCTVVMAALAEALPDRVTAGWNPLLCAIVNGHDERTDADYVDILINACKGGGGGTAGADGYSHVGLIASGGAIAAQDPEMFEAMNPFLVRRFEYRQDSGGAGQWRGGLGVETELELLSDGMQASIFGDGVISGSQAKGLLGGKDGALNHAELRYPDGQVRVLRAKELIDDIPKGTIYHQIAGGGGGYGDPRQRPPARVEEEVRDGLISRESARDDYGVEL
jgi:N-methylhydantoinase B